MPPDAVYVGRPSRWGNPWTVQAARRTWLDEAARRKPFSVVDHTHGVWLGTFVSEERARYWALVGFRRDFDADLEPLRGKRLACWCPEPCGEPCAKPRGHDGPHDPSVPPWCHADVLIELLEARGW
jgi:hypothetical protein